MRRRSRMIATITFLALAVGNPGAAISSRSQLVADIYSGPLSSHPAVFAVADDVLYFSAVTGTTGRELWRSNGSTSGTGLVTEIQAGTADGFPHSIAPFGDIVVFGAIGTDTGSEPWRSDGTATGTFMLADANPRESGSLPFGFTQVGGTTFFAAHTVGDEELWKSDGTQAGTARVKDIRPGPNPSRPNWFTRVGNRLLFSADDGVHENELWISDGTDAGTRLVADINPGSAASSPSWLVASDTTLFFAATNGVDGHELWKSDGTEAGTTIVKDINPGPSESFIRKLTVIDGVVYFVATDGSNGLELWRSDGTGPGTRMVKDVRSGPGDGMYLDDLEIAAAAGTILFVADDGSHGPELWRTNGTSPGTELVADIRPGAPGSYPNDIVDVGGIAFFAAYDGTHGAELWSSGGSAASTALVDDLNPGSADAVTLDAFAIADLAGVLMFAANDGTTGTELWKLNVGSTCRVDGRTLQVALAAGSSATLLQSANTLSVTGADVADPTCAGIATDTVDRVDVAGTVAAESLTLDLSGGRFTPGATPESQGESEIEIAVTGVESLAIRGSSGPDRVRFGSKGGNLNGDADVDVTTSGVTSLAATGGDGNDKLVGAGGGGTGTALTIPLTLEGDAGNDVLRGGTAGDVLRGGLGNDLFRELAAVDGADLILGGAGIDSVSYGARTSPVVVSLDGAADDGAAGERDNVGTDMENVTGGRGGDTIGDGGQAAKNRFVGGNGDDSIESMDGIDRNDRVDGSAGTDTCTTDAGDTRVACEA